MVDFLAIVASIILLTGVAMLIWAFIKKKPKKKAILITVIGFVMSAIIGSLLPDIEEDVVAEKEKVVVDNENEQKQEVDEKSAKEDKDAAEKQKADEELEKKRVTEEKAKKLEEETKEQKRINGVNAEKEAKEKAIKEQKEKDAAEKEEKLREQKAEEDKKKKAEKELPIERKIVKEIDYIEEASISENGVLKMVYREENPLTENSIVNAYSLRMLEAMHEAFKDPVVKEAEASIETAIYDAKGNESIKEVANFLYTRESFEELNYKKFIEMAESEGWRIYNEADLYYMVPVLYNNISEDFKSHLPKGISKFPPVTD